MEATTEQLREALVLQDAAARQEAALREEELRWGTAEPWARAESDLAFHLAGVRAGAQSERSQTEDARKSKCLSIR